MNFFLVAPLGRNNVPAVTAAVCSLLSEKGCGIYAAAPDSGHFPPQVVITDAATVCSQCDMILCIGGDGTIIDGAHYSAGFGLPVLGINAGRLGFLAQVEPRQADKAFDRILNGDRVFWLRETSSLLYRAALSASLPERLSAE